jgi:thiamine-phosphate pyrophosphorylase
MTVQDVGTRRREWLAGSRLCLAIEALPHGESAEPILRAALQNGVDAVLLREKRLEPAQIVQAARVFRRLCDAYDALFIVSDRPDLALVCGADGVHVGQGDADPAQARRFVGADLLIGQTVWDEVQADRSAADPAIDFLAIGDSVPELIAHTSSVDKPCFAVGAYEPSAALALGAGRAFVAEAISAADDPGSAAATLRAALENQAIHA